MVYDIIGWNVKKKRKPFGSRTKQIELARAGYKCRACRKPLKAGAYDFDHKDNNPANNSQNNCWVVCKNCHGKHTVTARRKVRDSLLGTVVGYKTVKKKVGYKKTTRKKTRKRKQRKDISSLDFRMPRIRF